MFLDTCDIQYEEPQRSFAVLNIFRDLSAKFTLKSKTISPWNHWLLTLTSEGAASGTGDSSKIQSHFSKFQWKEGCSAGHSSGLWSKCIYIWISLYNIYLYLHYNIYEYVWKEPIEHVATQYPEEWGSFQDISNKMSW